VSMNKWSLICSNFLSTINLLGSGGVWWSPVGSGAVFQRTPVAYPGFTWWSPIQELNEVDVPYFNERATELTLVATASLSCTHSSTVTVCVLSAVQDCMCIDRH